MDRDYGSVLHPYGQPGDHQIDRSYQGR